MANAVVSDTILDSSKQCSQMLRLYTNSYFDQINFANFKDVGLWIARDFIHRCIESLVVLLTLCVCYTGERLACVGLGFSYRNLKILLLIFQLLFYDLMLQHICIFRSATEMPSSFSEDEESGGTSSSVDWKRQNMDMRLYFLVNKTSLLVESSWKYVQLK